MKDDVSLVVAIIVTVFLILGSGLTLIGAIGLVRFSNFYERLHMPSLSTSWGAGSILISSFLYSIFVDHHFVFHEFLLVIFLFVTTPVSSMLLSQAAAYRNYSENKLKKPLALLSHQTDEKLSATEETS
ncbi:monovalent cation/proton antiporter, MnhG/PhaG subunit [Bartonella vinsonii subsp. arupensis OK-94-513]|uniref:Monovalent cation/proton antiporter, MnhG/PhaG subunit n=2 Tax=Bartonella vinsonii subsp. arupensis TaxID=110578 RepID=J0QUJ5_BARVI|nr:monovalent cation/H(+) antiporter subunit G [Bartonella vinsonii]EJF89596.1 monovalent cation/proton antiporter, MnhG/PhaG subunit [Bartonella vinsonii subsp. arupensis OK-94-513]EJF98244.1 monovalent cation/proton antiporter, MnhG/PhaG subunit [Bartonella vinsonii subsp. arupensis Pm136co]